MLKLNRFTAKNKVFGYCTKKTNQYSHTVLLPKTKLPLRLEGKKLVERDKNVYESAGFDRIYQWQKFFLTGSEYVLHDGPPYANGKPHMGHAINKILKDTILRYKILNGNKVHYVPGWDCHGLPIELKAVSNSKNLNPIELREKARNFATSTIEQQKSVFLSWGLIGDWQNCYKTYSVDYIENQLRQFYTLYEKGLVYRDVKPIHWSPSSRTALAESELEYNENHKSPSVYLRLEIKDIPNVPNFKGKRVYAVIWTTTPWTLPSNQGVCYNKSLSYCVVKKPDPFDTDLYIIATDLFDSFCKETNCTYLLLGVHSGDMLGGATYTHPVYKDRHCQFYHSSHATVTKGTGLVHMAPAHGPEDFLVALENKILVVDLIDDEGCYKPEAGEKLHKKFVLREGNKTVLNEVSEDVMHLGEMTHSYPYDWRTKKPLIVKASKQWFFDTEKVKHRAIELLDDVTILPKERSDIYKNILATQLEKRPYWCISRQRKWGVPIPVFYDKNSENTVLNEQMLNHFCKQLNTHGSDFWWKLPSYELLPPTMTNTEELLRGEDILDIWFDSGISWSKVLENEQVADMYLEGVDQFNGWFQSSLLTSVALRDKSPYKSIFVHSFAVDENGAKMSKSLGNVVDPVDVVEGKKGSKAYGVDTLRWWVACHANQVAMASISANVLDQTKDELQKIRSVLRFALGGMFDYNYNEKDLDHLLLIDRYMLHLLYQFEQKSKENISTFNFHKVNTSLAHLLTNPVSALYYSAIKDRLYCDPAESSSRKAAQFTLFQIFHTVSNAIAGIVPHLVEEMYSFLPQKNSESFFISNKVEPKDAWNDQGVEDLMNLILEIKKELNKEVGPSTVDKNISIKLREGDFRFLENFMSINQFEAEISDILQVSEVTVTKGDSLERFKLEISKNKGHSCVRCRRVKCENEENLCSRCSQVVSNVDICNKKAVSR